MLTVDLDVKVIPANTFFRERTDRVGLRAKADKRNKYLRLQQYYQAIVALGLERLKTKLKPKPKIAQDR